MKLQSKLQATQATNIKTTRCSNDQSDYENENIYFKIESLKLLIESHGVYHRVQNNFSCCLRRRNGAKTL